MLTEVLSGLRSKVLEIEIEHAFKRTVTITSLDLRSDAEIKKEKELSPQAILPPTPTTQPINPPPVAGAAATDPQDTKWDYLKAFNMEVFTTELAQRIPSLTHIGIYVHWLPTSQSYWEVSRARADNTEQVLLSCVGDFDTGKKRFWRGPEGKGTIGGSTYKRESSKEVP